MMSARDLGLKEEVIMEEGKEDQGFQPGNTELDGDYDSDVVPAEKSFVYHDDEHKADLEEDRSEEIAPNLCQDRRQSQPEKQLGHGS